MKIKQHFLPSFLLKRWKQENDKWYLLNRKNNTIEIIKTKQQLDNMFSGIWLYEDAFYKYNEIEDYLSEIENDYAQFTNSIIKQINSSVKKIFLNYKQICLIWIWDRIQTLRSIDSRKWFDKIYDNNSFNSIIKDIYTNYFLNIFKKNNLSFLDSLTDKYFKWSNKKKNKINSATSEIERTKIWYEMRNKIIINNSFSFIHFLSTYCLFISEKEEDFNTLNANLRQKINWNYPPYFGKEIFWIWKQPFSPHLAFLFFPKENIDILEYISIPALAHHEEFLFNLSKSQNLLENVKKQVLKCPIPVMMPDPILSNWETTCEISLAFTDYVVVCKKNELYQFLSENSSLNFVNEQKPKK